MADLSVFLPRTLHDLMAPALEGQPACKRERGSVLFCDIAGFTPLTEALSVIGREGSEELTRIINAYFSTMIAIVEEESGDVLRFGGDSMTLLFPGEARSRALDAAARMMRAMGEFEAVQTRAGVFGLTIKIGASHGDVLLGLVGDETLGFDYYAAGPPLDESAEAEHRAKPGWIVAHPALRIKDLPGTKGAPLPGGFTRVRGAGHALPIRAAVAPPPDDALLRRLVPRHLAERAGDGVLGEHRGTATLFLTFSGVPLATEGEAALATHRNLDSLYRSIASTARRYGGLVNKLDMGDKGCTALLLFGSPYAIEEREEMAVRAALEILSASDLPSGIRLKMGVTSAPLFTGPVGGPTRREFTAIGDGVNLAARLMQAAHEGKALCDAAVAFGASRALRFRALDPLAVKGKREPVPIFTPLGEAEEKKAEVQVLIGRDSACEALGDYLSGKVATPLCLAGEAGSGKTALIDWAAEQARTLGMPVVRVPLGPYSQERPYYAWRGVVRSLLGLGRNDSEETARVARDEALAKEPPGFRPLLNVFLDLPEETAPALRNLSAKERMDLRHSLAGRLLARSGGRAVLLDGIQWTDPLSLALLAFLLDTPEPLSWHLIAALRPGADEAERAAGAMRRVDLEPLGKRDVEALLKSAHGLTEVQPPVLEWFTARSKGIPGLLSALVSALDSEGLIQRFESVTRVDSDRLFTTSFPETLEGLYLARVDPLPRLERETLQFASILGASVSVNLLEKISEIGGQELKETLQSLEAAGFLRTDSWGDRPYLRFVEPLLQEALYASLPYVIKRSGHLKLARFLEPGAEKSPKLWPTLAHHFEQADEKEKARAYHRLAGRAAAERFDNVTALRHLEYVCALPESGPEDVEDAFALMDAYASLGRWKDAKPILERLAAGEHALALPHQARLQNYLARDLAAKGAWEGAEALLHKGVALAQKAGDVLLEAKGYVNLAGRVYGPTGQLEKAKLVLEKALALPEGRGRAVVRATAAMNLGSVFHHQGKLGGAKAAFHKAYREASKTRLGPQRGAVANNLCAILYESGQFEEAEKWGRRAILDFESFSLRGHGQSARYNLSMAQLANGRAAMVVRLLEDAERQARSFGDKQIQAQAKQGLSQALVFLGCINDSLALAGESLAAFRSIQNSRDYGGKLLDLGNLYHALDSRDAALGCWRASDVSTFVGTDSFDPHLERGLSRIGVWIRGYRPWAVEPAEFLAEAYDSSAEEKLHRLLWVAEAEAEAKQLEALRDLVPRLDVALTAWPYFDCRLRVLRLKAILQGGLDDAQKREARQLISRCMGGVWGIRLLCLMAHQEMSRVSARRLRKKALERLDFVKAHSPDWAWEKIAGFPEVRQVMEGR